MDESAVRRLLDRRTPGRPRRPGRGADRSRPAPQEVDYVSSWTALIESRKSSPYEAGLGWTVQLRLGRNFVGQRAALEREAASPSRWALAGLEADWLGIEERFAAVGLPPLVVGLLHGARREAPARHRSSIG